MIKLGITLGDPAGIGPEITLKALEHINLDLYDITLYGDLKVYEQIRSSINVSREIFNKIYIRDLNKIQGNIEYGVIKQEYGKAAGDYIELAIKDAIDGKIDAVVTSPIHKESFKLGGWGHKYPGHTEMFASLTDTENYSMLLACGNLRVLHLTTHIPFRDVSQYVTKNNVYDKIKLANDVCTRLGLDGNIGVAALNPHMGEHGLFGNEELEIENGILMATNEGINATLDSADVIFSKCLGGKYDIVLAMYHDQGHIPVKLAGFKHSGSKWTEMKGVNVTIGLPIIRTSVDHGVAFGKAGKGIADETSMIDAINYAYKLANK
jgi:4-hydroxythreonine-4-phosphate dehydrogenase